MKTLNEIKNEVAKSYGFYDWEDIPNRAEGIYDTVAEAYASQQPVSVSRETVEKMLEALKLVTSLAEMSYGECDTTITANQAIQQAEKELKS